MRETVLITGATSDIAKEIAIKLSNTSNLILLGRDLQRLEQIKCLCVNTENHFVFQFDFNNIESYRTDFSNFLITNGVEVNKLVHCAGMMKVMHMKSVDLKNANQIFNINVFSITETLAILLSKKINRNALNNVVFISAILSKFGSTGHHLYSSTKGALDGLMRSLAVELAPRIRVNSVLPGAVETKMSKHLLSDPLLLKNLNQQYLLGVGKPIDIANMVNFLLSDESSWITGQEFIVDGGRTINIKNS